MIRQCSRFVILALTLVALPCAAQNYCDLLNQPIAAGANPPRQTANEILKTLSDIAPFNYDSIMLRDARDPDLKVQGAAAGVCHQNQRSIFYDPDFIEQIQTKGNSYWPSYFVFAHEVAHHFNNDPLFHRPEQEKQADRAAAQWLTRLGASAYDLQIGINSSVLNEQSEPNYPSRCERLKG